MRFGNSRIKARKDEFQLCLGRLSGAELESRMFVIAGGLIRRKNGRTTLNAPKRPFAQ